MKWTITKPADNLQGRVRQSRRSHSEVRCIQPSGRSDFMGKEKLDMALSISAFPVVLLKWPLPLQAAMILPGLAVK